MRENKPVLMNLKVITRWKSEHQLTVTAVFQFRSPVVKGWLK